MTTASASDPRSPVPAAAVQPASAANSRPDGPEPFDVVKTYFDLLASDPEMTMPVAAIQSLIELLRVTPASTAMETVELVKTHKERLLGATPNPLPLLAGADLFEQFLTRSLRGQTDVSGSDRVLSFDEITAHLLQNGALFAERARSARDQIATYGSKYVVDKGVVLTVGGSRVVNRILLRAAANRTRHFKVIHVLDGSPRSDASIQALRDAGLEVETISASKVAYVLSNVSALNLVLVGAEVVLQNGGVISRMGTCQLAHLAKTVDGSQRRFYVAAETHKIARATPIAYPMVNRVGVKQRDISKWDTIGRQPENVAELLAEQDEVDYTEPELISGVITEQGVKMPWQIWEMVDY